MHAKLITVLAATMFACAAASATAADTKPAPAMKQAEKAEAKLEKPANVTQQAWDKMSVAEKKKAVEKANAKNGKPAEKTATAPKKPKKGGC